MTEFPRDQKLQESVEVIVELKTKLDDWVSYVAEQKGVPTRAIASTEDKRVLLQLAYKEFSANWMDLS